MDFYICWSSQTGNTVEMAKQFRDECQFNNINITKVEEISQNLVFHQGIWIIFLSTTGQGSPPSNMRAFWQLIMKKSYKLTNPIYFAVYSLGDSSYGDNFGIAARKLRQRLKMLGAQQFQQIGLGDDLDSLGFRQVYINQWKDKVLAYLQINARRTQKPQSLYSIELRDHSKQIQFQVQNIEFLSENEGRKVYWVTLDIRSKIQLNNGDIIQIFPFNREEDVNYLLKEISENCELTPQHLRTQLTQKYNLSCTLNYYFFTNKNKKHICELVKDEIYKEKVVQFSNDYSEYFNYFIKYRRNLRQFMLDFQISKLDFSYCQNYLNEIKGRKYSIARIKGNKVYLLIKLVQQNITPNRLYRGLCSHDLLGCLGKARKGRIIRGQITPKELRKNNIIITLGTGIAPFIWILDSLQTNSYECTLFYTNSYKNQIYHKRLVKVNLNKNYNEIISCTRQGGLRMIRLIQSESQRLFTLINKFGIKQTRIFYCGPKDIYQFLVDFFSKLLQITKVQVIKAKLILYENW